MTPTSEERREVATRLRELPSDTYAARKEWEKDGLFIDSSLRDEADYSQIHNVVLGCFPAEHMHPGDYKELHELLADLIDPATSATTFTPGVGLETYPPFPIRLWKCARCGEETIMMYDEGEPVACPYCGAVVVSDDD